MTQISTLEKRASPIDTVQCDASPFDAWRDAARRLVQAIGIRVTQDRGKHR